MGWISYHATYYKNGKVDRIAEIRSQFESGSRYKVLKASLVGSVVYMAVERQIEDERIVFAAVVLTSTDSKDYYNFSYKGMDETCGPYHVDCPASILNLLTPTTSEYALHWREACWETIKSKREKRKNPDSLSNLPIGTLIEMKYWKEEKPLIRLVKKNVIGYARPLWIDQESGRYKYAPKTIEGQGYTVISRP